MNDNEREQAREAAFSDWCAQDRWKATYTELTVAHNAWRAGAAWQREQDDAVHAQVAELKAAWERHQQASVCRAKTRSELCEHLEKDRYVAFQGSDGAQEIRCRNCGACLAF